MPDRSIIPIIKDAVSFEFNLPDIENRVGKNGIPFYFYNAGSQDVLQIEWVFEAGLWNEHKTGVSQAFTAIFKNGTQRQTEMEVNEALEFYGASFKISNTNDYTSMTLHCLTKHLSSILPVIFEMMTEPMFDEQELSIYQQKSMQHLQIKLMNCDFVANRHIEAMVFGKAHPYGRYSEIADVAALNRDDLIQFFEENFSYSRCNIFVAGKFEASDMNMIEQQFGEEKWNDFKQNQELNTPIIQASEDKVFKLINNEDGVQAAIRMSAPFVSRTHPDFLPVQILNTILGGYFGSRLMSNIREEKGYTYGIYSYVAAFKHAAMLMITAEVNRNSATAAIAEIIKEMDILKRELVSDAELLLVKNYVLGSLLSDLDGPFSVMRLWKTLVLNNENKSDFDKRVSVFKKVQTETIREVAQKYLNAEDFFQVIVV